MEGLIEAVIDRYDGSLKAEHGTGLNMALFVEREWGPEGDRLYRASSASPTRNGAGAGVVINDDPGVHLRNLKTTPAIEEEVTSRVECGFAQRLLQPPPDHDPAPADRPAARDGAPGPRLTLVLEALLEQAQYDVVEQPGAADGPASARPVGIDTGKFVKELRARQHSRRAEKVALRLAGGGTPSSAPRGRASNGVTVAPPARRASRREAASPGAR